MLHPNEQRHTQMSNASPHNELHHTSNSDTTPQWAMQYPMMSYATPHNEQRNTPMSNATPQGATPHPIMGYITPQWATLHPNKPRHTPWSATPHPDERRHTQVIHAILKKIKSLALFVSETSRKFSTYCNISFISIGKKGNFFHHTYCILGHLEGVRR